NIVLKICIDLSKFDITTLVPLKSSHDFFTRINGNKVEFIFENINLDFNDATNDGYVLFKIKTLPSLVLGDTFTNNANIYFDYNFPITTNTYTTTVAALSTQDFDFGTYFTLYPNPAKDVLNIQAKQDLKINSIEIYNQLGQIVMASTNTLNTIDVSNLASGTYFVKINTQKGSANVKFVKE
ncbi:MAG: T9SS type A sorting domain-containing protein, partial [Flavobacterium sp.]|nr:T9SS type A sorting domain-containing protein [Flavobacterium sp.]